MIYPVIIYYLLTYLGSRKQNKEFFRKTLTRDREIEKTFFNEIAGFRQSYEKYQLFSENLLL